MNLNLSILAHHMREMNPTLCGVIEQALHCADIRCWDGSADANPAYGYLCRWELLSRQDHCPSRVICIGGEAAAVDWLSERGGEALVVSDTDTDALFLRLRDVFVHYNHLDEELTQGILADQPLGQLLNKAADFFQNPILATDAALTFLATSDNYPYGEGDLAWRELQKTGRSSASMLNRLKSKRLVSKLHTTPKALFVDVGKDITRTITVNIFEHKERVASLSVSESQGELSPWQLGLADHIAARLSPRLRRHSKSITYGRSQVRTYIGELLHGQRIDPQIIRPYLERIGWDPEREFLLLRIALPAHAFTDGTASHSKNTYESLFAHSLSFDLHDTVVLILNDPRDDQALQGFAQLQKSLSSDGALCGVSLPFRDFFTLHQQYLLAGIALELGDKGGIPTPYRYYFDVMASHLLGELSGTMPLGAICHTGVLGIQQYDRDNGTELVASLQTYLFMERSLVKGAAALHIHRNTLVYRLDRISKIVELDLENPLIRMHVLFSCVLLQHMGSADGRQK